MPRACSPPSSQATPPEPVNGGGATGWWTDEPQPSSGTAGLTAGLTATGRTAAGRTTATGPGRTASATGRTTATSHTAAATGRTAAATATGGATRSREELVYDDDGEERGREEAEEGVEVSAECSYETSVLLLVGKSKESARCEIDMVTRKMNSPLSFKPSSNHQVWRRSVGSGVRSRSGNWRHFRFHFG